MTQVTVTGRFTHPNQSPASGYVEFTPRPSRVILPGGSGPVELGAVQAPLDGTGRFTVSLQASDDPNIDPSGWTYEVREAVSGGVGRTYDIEVPAATVGSLDLATVMPVESASGSVTLTPGPQGPVGPIGPTGATGATGATGPQGNPATNLVTSVDGLQGVVNLSQVRASIRGARPGNRVVVLGASIENLSSFVTATSESFGKDWPTYAMLLANGRFNMIRNMAIGGQTTQQFIDRFDTDITPSAPNIVPLGSVENDIQGGVTNAQKHANIRTLTNKCRAIGALPVWRTAMPHNATGVHTPTAEYNAWLKEYCASEGLPCIDFWTVLVDPTTGMYKPAWTVEGVHPNEIGSYLLAQYWLEQMDGYLPPGAFPLPLAATDTGQLLPTPLFTAGSAGTPTGWNAIGGLPAGVTRSLITDPLGYGQLARHVHVGSASAVSLQTNSANITPTQASVGDVLEISGRLNSDGGVPAAVIVTFTTDGVGSPSLSRVPVSNITHALDNGTYKQIMPPIGAGFLRCQVTLQSGPGTGVVDFSYPVMRNLTREGSFPI